MAQVPPKHPDGHDHGQNVVEAAIDPSLVDHSQATNSGKPTSTSVGNAKLPDDDKSLKRTWLTLLPAEQVIEILMKLDECVADDHSIKHEVWPTDLKAAVFHAAVAKIVQSSRDTTAAVTGNDNGKGGAVEATMSPTMDSKKVKGDSMKGPPPATTKAASTAKTIVHTPSPAPSVSPVPPLTSIVPRTSPPTSTTTYQAAASASSYPYYPYSTGSFPYASHHSPYSFSYGPSTSSSSISIPPAHVPSPSSSMPAVPVAEDEDDLPSYEEMLVQALTVHNHPEGTAPKQLFQWMAATYPLQANFRPSASQALQKAYKRGRFEKNNEGRYRLNPLWRGGNTSRRTTRRPQSYSKAVLNPSPSSHPATNTSQFLPQHYTWTYGGRTARKSQSPAQSPASISSPATVPTGISSQAPKQLLRPSTSPPRTEETDRDHESHRSCMEAAYSILQALNITGTDASNILGSSSARGNDTNVPSRDTGRPASTGGISSLPATSASPKSHVSEPLPSSTTSDLGVSGAPSPSVQASRAALQGSLAFLAAQLADFADGPSSGGSEQATAPAGLTSLNFLEGIGINLNLDLAQRGLDVEPAK